MIESNSTRSTTADHEPAIRATPSGRANSPTAYEWLVACLTASGLHRAGAKWQCPAHGRTGMHTAALALGPRDDGTGAWLHCHAGCSFHAVLDALELRPVHLRRPPRVTPTRYVESRGLRRDWPALKDGRGADPIGAGYRHESWHYYGPDHRKERLRRPSDGEKTLRWESRNHRGEWVPGLLGTREADLPLYREHEITMAAGADEPVILCESESSCDVLREHYATTWAGGAGSPPVEHLAHVLSAIDVVVVPDHDDAGLACLQRLLEVLSNARVLLGQPGEDARDLHRRVGPAVFEELVRRAPKPSATR